MKEFSQSFKDHLASGATTLAYCWVLERSDGVSLGFTDHDKALMLDGIKCEPASGFTASQSRESADFSVSDQEISGILSSHWLKEQDLASGLFDGARIQTWRVNWQNTQEKHLLRSGYLGEIKRSDKGFSAEIRSATAQMDREKGRVYQTSCDALLGDDRCKLDLTDKRWFRLIEIEDAPTETGLHFTLKDGEAEVESSFFTLGKGEVLSGAAAQQSFDILNHQQNGASGDLESWIPLPLGLAVGDQVKLFAGCDKRFERCKSRFDNVLNFQGFPHMPGNDFLLGYPGKGRRKDGSALHGAQG
ncbi:MAG: DUF2163 domain-containing protein [Cohaesibacter sp.]|jgi:uncharacterized phage protein (TIGR02218 family)|nr:DUF2163 domain-containing protein [Cohaesibacter sp.]